MPNGQDRAKSESLGSGTSGRGNKMKYIGYLFHAVGFVAGSLFMVPVVIAGSVFLGMAVAVKYTLNDSSVGKWLIRQWERIGE